MDLFRLPVEDDENGVALGEQDAARRADLRGAMEELDDVQNVSTNAELPVKELAGA